MQSLSSNVDGPGSDKEQERTNHKEGASYATLAPYTPVSTKKKEKPRKKGNEF